MRAKLVTSLIVIASLIVLSVVIVQAGEFKGSWSANTGSWEGTITYTFEDSDAKRWTDAERGVVRAAIAAWEEKSEGVRWKEVESDADIPFKWGSLDRDKGGKITRKSDKPNGVIFNTDVDGGWYVDPFPATDEVVLFTKSDLLSVAIHEVGHALGLKHSFGEKASMDSWGKGERQRITAVDEAQLFKFYPEGPYLEFLGRDDLPDAIVSKTYPGYSFCDPIAIPGRFCGGPLTVNPDTTNPTGGTPNYTFSIDGVGLPFGLTLNLNGLLEGRPRAGTPTGLQRFNVCATDQVGAKVCRQFKIDVKPAPRIPTPTFTPTPTPTPTPRPTNPVTYGGSFTIVMNWNTETPFGASGATGALTIMDAFIGFSDLTFESCDRFYCVDGLENETTTTGQGTFTYKCVTRGNYTGNFPPGKADFSGVYPNIPIRAGRIDGGIRIYIGGDFFRSTPVNCYLATYQHLLIKTTLIDIGPIVFSPDGGTLEFGNTFETQSNPSTKIEYLARFRLVKR